MKHLFLFLILILVQATAANEKLIVRTLSFPVMSTQANLKFYGKDEKELEKAFQTARSAMEDVIRICNIFDPASELARLNTSAAKEPFACSPELWEILNEARKFHTLSGGVFDPTVQPLMKIWGFHRKRQSLPLPKEIADAKAICGFSKVKFDKEKHTVFFTVPGMSLDLGGIAKGWAVDKASEAVLRNTSIRIGIVDLGGNIRCFPQPPPGKDHYTVAVKNPKKPGSYVALAFMLDECAATSGNYERYVVIDGKQYTHIIDPRTGYPVEGVLSATVITKRGVDSDALSTSVFINGGLEVKNARILRIDGNGKIMQKIPHGEKEFRLLP